MSVKRILIVEDDESVKVLLKLFLMRMNYKQFEAKNGMEGLGMAKQFQPDLIITDLSMPEMDGITFIKAIRADEKLKNTPIIALSGASLEFQHKALDAGADAVLDKPIYRRGLLDLIDLIFTKR